MVFGALVAILLLWQSNRRLRQKMRVELELSEVRRTVALEKLAGGIAHDFNNILGAIDGFASFIQEDIPPTEMPHQFSLQILAACDRGKALVEHFLIYARRHKHELHPYALSDIVTEFESAARNLLPTNIALNCQNLAPNLSLQTDKYLLTRAILLIISNARDALANQEGTIDITVTRQDAQSILAPNTLKIGAIPNHGKVILFKISDNGFGIAPDIIGQIFDPFFTTKAIGKGCGLGLPVVQGIVLALNGAITVFSEEGQGATFTLYFAEEPA